MEIAAFQLPAFAKINLSLHILGRRPDGYHEIVTVMQTISLADRLTFAYADEIVLECSGPVELSAGEDNLILRAARALQKRYRVSAGAKIRLEKQVPIGAGLGGGSSDAATTLVGLRRLWGLRVTDAELATIAAELGADVPFFLFGGTAIASGIGTQIQKAADVAIPPALIVTPDVAVRTAYAYSLLKAENLTIDASNRILPVCRQIAESGEFPISAMKNDFEAAIFSAFPEISRVRNALIESGAIHAMLSGSGSSVIGFFDNEETRQAAMKALDNEVNWRKFAVAAIGREDFRAQMKLS